MSTLGALRDSCGNAWCLWSYLVRSAGTCAARRTAHPSHRQRPRRQRQSRWQCMRRWQSQATRGAALNPWGVGEQSRSGLVLMRVAKSREQPSKSRGHGSLDGGSLQEGLSRAVTLSKCGCWCMAARQGRERSDEDSGTQACGNPAIGLQWPAHLLASCSAGRRAGGFG